MKIPYSSYTIIALISAFLLLGCYSVYSENPLTRTAAYPKAVEQAKKDNRYFVLHSGNDTYKVSSVLVEKSKKQFTVHLAKIDSLHTANATDLDPRNKSNEQTRRQMHLYLKDTTSYTLDEPHTIAFEKVTRIQWVD